MKWQDRAAQKRLKQLADHKKKIGDTIMGKEDDDIAAKIASGSYDSTVDMSGLTAMRDKDSVHDLKKMMEKMNEDAKKLKTSPPFLSSPGAVWGYPGGGGGGGGKASVKSGSVTPLELDGLRNILATLDLPLVHRAMKNAIVSGGTDSYSWVDEKGVRKENYFQKFARKVDRDMMTIYITPSSSKQSEREKLLIGALKDLEGVLAHGSSHSSPGLPPTMDGYTAQIPGHEQSDDDSLVLVFSGLPKFSTESSLNSYSSIEKFAMNVTLRADKGWKAVLAKEPGEVKLGPDHAQHLFGLLDRAIHEANPTIFISEEERDAIREFSEQIGYDGYENTLPKPILKPSGRKPVVASGPRSGISVTTYPSPSGLLSVLSSEPKQSLAMQALLRTSSGNPRNFGAMKNAKLSALCRQAGMEPGGMSRTEMTHLLREAERHLPQITWTVSDLM